MAQQTLPLLLFSLQLTIFLTIIYTAESSVKVPAVIVFGDSTVDAGNNNGLSTMLKSNFMPYGRDFEGGKPTGRFSNGRVPGTSFPRPSDASPPCRLTWIHRLVLRTSPPVWFLPPLGLSVIPLWKELDYFKDYQNKLRAYLGPQKADETLSEALYIIRLVVRLNSRFPGIRVVFSNPYDALLNIIQNPSQFGFENVAVACCASGMFEMGYMCNRFNPFTCTDANKYVFWDSFHPTERANALISDYVVKNCLAQFL
ncbi:hypothetical protein Sjap_025146 [Stephania japonica]|uniref:GDSL esterase/lipase n=1 Tax=Stephania japonica TaxID=461633 RepID=A0AAP0HJC4_9MAGN